ncbi:hypothetical protein AVEN_145213-1 [Araneus ventricosus]|uniref:Secreted protein n=1 Tax=Araneus ventricosus TaxID=182803 RepID=A0A4Y2N3V6_ARAVE|nr:hypothetical protein AVEN_145213-1 [Araneus ventricosus]
MAFPWNTFLISFFTPIVRWHHSLDAVSCWLFSCKCAAPPSSFGYFIIVHALTELHVIGSGIRTGACPVCLVLPAERKGPVADVGIRAHGKASCRVVDESKLPCSRCVKDSMGFYKHVF